MRINIMRDLDLANVEAATEYKKIKRWWLYM